MEGLHAVGADEVVELLSEFGCHSLGDGDDVEPAFGGECELGAPVRVQPCCCCSVGGPRPFVLPVTWCSASVTPLTAQDDVGIVDAGW